MPTESPPKSRLQSALERPFPRLVAHFLDRLVRGGHDAGSDFELSAGALLGLLAAPGAFTCFLMLDKYSTLLNWLRHRPHEDLYTTSAPDKYLLIALSMAVTGIVTVLKWDRILPDAQDYLNLAPLPIAARRILAANAAAIGLAVCIFAFDVNAVPAVLFPLFVTAAAETTVTQFVAFVAVHAFVLMLASLFTFCAVFAVLGPLSAVLPREAFRAVAAWLRGGLLVAFVMLLFSGWAGPALLMRLGRPGSLVEWLPSIWFVGLYQSLQHHATTPALAQAARMAWEGSAAAFGLMLVSYAAGYRRGFAAVLETAPRPAGRRPMALALLVLDAFAPRAAGFERACHRFVVRALLRSEAHRLAISVAVGLGWLLAVQDAAAGKWLEAPLVAAYLLILALRLAFEIPAALPANWIFRSTLDARMNQTLPTARRLMLAFLIPCVIVPWFALDWWKDGAGRAALESLYVLALAVSAGEILLAGYRKLPLTCPLPGFRDNLLMLCLIQFLSFEFFTRAGAALEAWMLEAPARFVLAPAAMAAAWWWNLRRLRDAREAGELEEGLTFESLPPPVVERLDLSGAG